MLYGKSQLDEIDSFCFIGGHNMKSFSRRTFLKTSAVAALSPYARVLGANNDIRVAIIGLGNKGGLEGLL